MGSRISPGGRGRLPRDSTSDGELGARGRPCQGPAVAISWAFSIPTTLARP